MKNIVLVRQEHPWGCGLACLAMLLGVEYSALFKTRYAHINFETSVGISNFLMAEELTELGFAYSKLWRFKSGNIERTPWPPQPWADVHLIMIELQCRKSHWALWLRDGRVFDPYYGETDMQNPNYKSIQQISGIYKVGEPMEKLTV